MAESKNNMKGSEFPNSPKVELIEFFRPYKSEVNLYVTNISRRLEKEVVQVRLLDIFSQFGLIYEVQVMDSSDNSEEEINSNCGSSYAFVKFYSARAARRAKENIHGKWILGGLFLKVRFAQRKKFTEVRRPLYMAKCTVLANYYLGFNGWSTRITQLDRLENRSEAGDSQERTNAVYRCVVRLEIKDCEFFCEGTGYGGDKNILEQG
ncbi:RAD52 motif-containing protein 1-like isoform X2 [Stylophora pistillata]|uniref:RAD52 motif-containing protein 1-like isoform X2 n=1 Tax=Stylophora pistillata TaxID=50429 RepID=UPI000C044C8D|nr:RAD52 motif-containing protein 1-like isoform X2 [Stylophora pistillata]